MLDPNIYSPELGPELDYDIFNEHVIVDYDIPNKIISAKFKPGSPFKRVSVAWFYKHTKVQCIVRNDLVVLPQFVCHFFEKMTFENGIGIERTYISLEYGWDFSEYTKKILSGYWLIGKLGY